MTHPLSTLVADLAVPGRILAFCDETDLTKEDATSTMVADIHLHAAVVLPSDGYGALAASLAAALETFGVAEFHAVDIVNNGKKSAWYERSKADRLAALTASATTRSKSPSFSSSSAFAIMPSRRRI
jgi:hypothetical protein